MMKNALIAILALTLSLTSVFATNIFMQLDGIKGDSVEDKHQNWIDANSVQIGVGRSCEPRSTSADKECSTPTFSEMTLTMPTSSATPALYKEIAGKAMGKLVIDVTRSSKNENEVYLQYTLEDALVSGISTSVDADGTAQDSISFSFGKVTMEVFNGNPDSRNVFTYNTETAKVE